MEPCRLFIGNLPLTTTEKDIKLFFEKDKLGKVSLIQFLPRGTKKTRSCFLTMQNPSCLKQCARQYDCYPYRGQSLVVQLSYPDDQIYLKAFGDDSQTHKNHVDTSQSNISHALDDLASLLRMYKDDLIMQDIQQNKLSYKFQK